MTTTTPDREVLRRLLRERLATPATAPPPAGQLYGDHVNRYVHRLLSALDLDVSYVGGSGTVLTDAAGRRYLDFAGAYGALPLGHNPDVVWQAVNRVQAQGEPSLTQLSVPAAAAELAGALVTLAPAGLTSVTFANSGAETVEAALKMARSATGRVPVLSTDGSFHGKTLGALSATGNAHYQEGFGAPAHGFDRVPFGDAAAVERALAGGEYAAVLVEPIQGEGGVRVPPPGYLRALRQACDDHGVLLVLDEVQTGLGRTGPMFAFEEDGIVPDIVTVAKALGGGLLPVGAVLAREGVAGEHFLLRHTSTFAGGALACRVGLAVVGALREPALRRNVEDRSAQLVAGLRAVAERHPGVVVEVRGRGLLLGVELTGDVGFLGRQSMLGSIAEGGNLAMLLASHLLAAHGIRIAPTLFGNDVLRVEPPLTVTEEECRTFLVAFERTVELAAAGNTAGLLAHLVGAPVPALPAPTTRTHVWRAPAPGETRFGFVAHPLDAAGLADFDTSFESWDEDSRSALLARLAAAASELNPAPFLIGSGEVRSDAGPRAYGELVGVPYTAVQLLSLPSAQAVRVVREAVELAAARGAELVGLGAYSSIVTDNARALGPTPVPVTTGNSFTAASSIEAVRRSLAESGRELAQVTVAVVGAGGAIGRVIATILGADAGRVVLVGRPGGAHAPRMLGTRDALLGRGVPESRISLLDDTGLAARQADVVVTATSSPQTLLDVADLRPGAIVCDVAQPANVPADLTDRRPDVTHFDGGIVRMPGGRDFGVRHGLAPGVTYACMAETMLLALETAAGRPVGSLFSRGEELSLAAVSGLAGLAGEHGFRLAAPHTWRTSR